MIVRTRTISWSVSFCIDDGQGAAHVRGERAGRIELDGDGVRGVRRGGEPGSRRAERPLLRPTAAAMRGSTRSAGHANLSCRGVLVPAPRHRRFARAAHRATDGRTGRTVIAVATRHGTDPRRVMVVLTLRRSTVTACSRAVRPMGRPHNRRMRPPRLRPSCSGWVAGVAAARTHEADTAAAADGPPRSAARSGRGGARSPTSTSRPRRRSPRPPAPSQARAGLLDAAGRGGVGDRGGARGAWSRPAPPTWPAAPRSPAASPSSLDAARTTRTGRRRTDVQALPTADARVFYDGVVRRPGPAERAVRRGRGRHRPRSTRPSCARHSIEVALCR